jgi:hypothetical protein
MFRNAQRPHPRKPSVSSLDRWEIRRGADPRPSWFWLSHSESYRESSSMDRL